MLRPFNLCEGVSEPHSFDFETAGLRQIAMTEFANAFSDWSYLP
jgi:hypothetical protein